MAGGLFFGASYPLAGAVRDFEELGWFTGSAGCQEMLAACQWALGNVRRAAGTRARAEGLWRAIGARALGRPQTVYGTITVADEFGNQHAGESGRLGLRIWHHDESEGIPGRVSDEVLSLKVVKGCWAACVPFGASLSFERVRLGGQQADAPAHLDVPDNGIVSVLATWDTRR